MISHSLFGIRVSLAVGIGSINVLLLVGARLGLVGGYYGGWFAALMTRLTDVVAFPAMLPAFTIMIVLGSSLLVQISLAISDAIRNGIQPILGGVGGDLGKDSDRRGPA